MMNTQTDASKKRRKSYTACVKLQILEDVKDCELSRNAGAVKHGVTSKMLRDWERKIHLFKVKGFGQKKRFNPGRPRQHAVLERIIYNKIIDLRSKGLPVRV